MILKGVTLRWYDTITNTASVAPTEHGPRPNEILGLLRAAATFIESGGRICICPALQHAGFWQCVVQ